MALTAKANKASISPSSTVPGQNTAHALLELSPSGSIRTKRNETQHTAQHRLKSTDLSWADLDVEVAPLVRDLQNLGPGEAVNPQAVAVDQQAVGTDAQHDLNPF